MLPQQAGEGVPWLCDEAVFGTWRPRWRAQDNARRLVST